MRLLVISANHRSTRLIQEAVGGSEVEVKAGPLREPLSDQRCFVSAAIVQHDVNVKIGGYISFDGVQKPAEFLRKMVALQLANNPAGLQIDSSE